MLAGDTNYDSQLNRARVRHSFRVGNRVSAMLGKPKPGKCNKLDQPVRVSPIEGLFLGYPLVFKFLPYKR